MIRRYLREYVYSGALHMHLISKGSIASPKRGASVRRPHQLVLHHLADRCILVYSSAHFCGVISRVRHYAAALSFLKSSFEP
jgi:hypothetical protein